LVSDVLGRGQLPVEHAERLCERPLLIDGEVDNPHPYRSPISSCAIEIFQPLRVAEV
jgi:hypothetical protein